MFNWVYNLMKDGITKDLIIAYEKRLKHIHNKNNSIKNSSSSST